MSDIDPEVGKVLKDCGLGQEAAWKHKQSGKWIVYHWALERAAATRGIKFDLPEIVHADPEKKLATIVVVGHLDDKSEWSFGEAAPYNTQQTYPFAMAEKRAKDRVILKLIGLHGRAYSEEEADDFKTPQPAMKKGNPPGITEFRQRSREFYKELYACTDYDMYRLFVDSKEARAFMEEARSRFPDDWHGDGGDIKGIKRDMEEFRDRLKREKEAA